MGLAMVLEEAERGAETKARFPGRGGVGRRPPRVLDKWSLRFQVKESSTSVSRCWERKG